MGADVSELATGFDLERLTAEFYVDPTRPIVHCGRTSRSSGCERQLFPDAL